MILLFVGVSRQGEDVCINVRHSEFVFDYIGLLKSCRYQIDEVKVGYEEKYAERFERMV